MAADRRFIAATVAKSPRSDARALSFQASPKQFTSGKTIEASCLLALKLQSCTF